MTYECENCPNKTEVPARWFYVWVPDGRGGQWAMRFCSMRCLKEKLGGWGA